MSCLFNTLNARLGCADSRGDIVRFMEDNKETVMHGSRWADWIQASEGVSADEYIEKMRHPGTWGGGPELDAASILYRVDINVIYGQRTIRVQTPGATRSIDISYNGGHYW